MWLKLLYTEYDYLVSFSTLMKETLVFIAEIKKRHGKKGVWYLQRQMLGIIVITSNIYRALL